MILVGLGGILVEVFKDVAIHLAHDQAEALEMIESLSCPLFMNLGGPERTWTH